MAFSCFGRQNIHGQRRKGKRVLVRTKAHRIMVQDYVIGLWNKMYLQVIGE